jgi:hypothetical protein
VKTRIAVSALAFAAVVASTSTSSLSQEQLPKQMSGSWGATLNAPSGPVRVSGAWVLKVESQDPSGALKGKISYMGNRNCVMEDAPMVGTMSGNQLVLEALPSDKFAGAGCSKTGWKFVMQKTAGGYEGDLQGAANAVQISLKP